MNQNETHSTPRAAAFQKLQLSEIQTEVDAAADYGLFPAIEVEVLADVPVTLLVSPKAGGSKGELNSALEFIASRLFGGSGSKRPCLFRGVELDRLSQIVSTGCDVIPSTAPIYASPHAAKALEYGDVVMAFDLAKLEKTFREVSKSENPETLDRLRQEYPTVLEMDGDWLWFSKLPPDDERTGTIYESYYTFFIPGDPREALLLLFLIGTDRDALRTQFLQSANP